MAAALIIAAAERARCAARWSGQQGCEPSPGPVRARRRVQAYVATCRQATPRRHVQRDPRRPVGAGRLPPCSTARGARRVARKTFGCDGVQIGQVTGRRVRTRALAKWTAGQLATRAHKRTRIHTQVGGRRRLLWWAGHTKLLDASPAHVRASGEGGCDRRRWPIAWSRRRANRVCRDDASAAHSDAGEAHRLPISL